MSASGLQRRGRVMAMVCDGVNDAAALARDDIGLSMGTGDDVAIEASDLTMARGDLLVPADAIDLSQRTLAPTRATCSGRSPTTSRRCPGRCRTAQPDAGLTAMEFSSVCVVANSLRLRRFQSVTEHEVEEPRSWARVRWRRSRLDLHAGVSRCSSLPSKALVVSRWPMEVC